MKRDLKKLCERHYDLCVIGGGIYGACVAWDATLRGLSVALVEKNDFGSATSSNSLKIIHGGLRYLQHANFKRMRASILEQKTLMRIAPHLVHPLPVLLPTTGFALHSKIVMAMALAINNLVGFDRNQKSDPQKKLPSGRVLSKADYLDRMPGIASEGITGGALFYDAQVYHSERLVLSFLRSAAERGAAVANYAQAIDVSQADGQVTGLTFKDVFTDTQYTLRAKTLINTTGPWVNTIYDLLQNKRPPQKPRFAKAINLVTRPLFSEYAVGLSSKRTFRDPDAILNKGSRLFFIVPWRERSIIGTTYESYDGHADDFKLTPQEIRAFLNQVNQVCPHAHLKMQDVYFAHGGLLPMEGGSEGSTGDVQLSKHGNIQDHREQGIKGLLSIVGVKYTTARRLAGQAVSQALTLLGKNPVLAATSLVPLHDGDIPDFSAYLGQAIRNNAKTLDVPAMQRLLYHYGTAYSEVLSLWDRSKAHSETGCPSTLKAEILYGIRKEMAQKLSDIVFRRTDLGTAGHPGAPCLHFCAEVMAAELGWDKSVCDQEIQAVEAHFQKYGLRNINKDQNVRNTLADSFI